MDMTDRYMELEMVVGNYYMKLLLMAKTW